MKTIAIAVKYEDGQSATLNMTYGGDEVPEYVLEFISEHIGGRETDR